MMRLEKNDRTIVVGDDDSEIRSFLEMTLRYQGYSVELARDGNEVLNYLESKRPVSAVLLDIFMPEKNGFQTLREIRFRERGRGYEERGYRFSWKTAGPRGIADDAGERVRTKSGDARKGRPSQEWPR
jgi:CheY-like chemotaxis protein